MDRRETISWCGQEKEKGGGGFWCRGRPGWAGWSWSWSWRGLHPAVVVDSDASETDCKRSPPLGG